jgi:hypothetical protein
VTPNRVLLLVVAVLVLVGGIAVVASQVRDSPDEAPPPDCAAMIAEHGECR